MGTKVIILAAVDVVSSAIYSSPIPSVPVIATANILIFSAIARSYQLCHDGEQAACQEIFDGCRMDLLGIIAVCGNSFNDVQAERYLYRYN
jgi:hypothetical protein